MASGFASIPAGRRAGARRVVRTGLALVHENEIVYPQPGSAAALAAAIDDGNADVELHFPVVIEIVDLAADDRSVAMADRAADEAQERLAAALARR